MSNNTESITGFLINLDINLAKSLGSFANIQTLSQKIDNKTLIQTLLKSINSKLNKYIECLAPYIEEVEQENLSSSEYKDKFKDSMNKYITMHKDKRDKYSKPTTLYKSIQQIDEKDISPNQINIPIIHNLCDMTPMFYWYEGDSYHKQGIYTCIADGFYIKVPFPSTISTLDKNFKMNSIPCKYETKEYCLKNKKYISEIYKTDVRECSYVHKKEKFEKIGSIYKCSIENFGNYDRLKNDLNYIGMPDIKRILMYSSSDALLASIWYQNKFNDGELVISNLDIF
jgi:hypothetical protein